VNDQYQYLALMGACVLVTLPLEFVFRARVYRRIQGLIWALLPVVVIFSIWDIFGILRDHWSYNPRFVTGLQLGLGMPVEELVFFVVVPICGLLSYEAVGQVLRLARRRTAVADARRG
jgi:lycopene beta-cyclase